MAAHDHGLTDNGIENIQKLNNLYGQFYKGKGPKNSYGLNTGDHAFILQKEQSDYTTAPTCKITVSVSRRSTVIKRV